MMRYSMGGRFYSRQSPLIEPAFAHSGRSVSAVLDAAVDRLGLPVSITVDHGTEFMSKALEEWAWRRGVTLDFIRPGKPNENAHIESFNGRLRDENARLKRLVADLTLDKHILSEVIRKKV